jgi:hypothetical protein
MIRSPIGIWQLKRLLICAVLLLLCDPARANTTELKDVRIGEYEDFTRVVFEFSEAVTAYDLDDRTPGRLAVRFPDALPELTRKIPIDNSTRIKAAQLWQKGTTVSAILDFPFQRYRLDSFTLSEPHRIAIDIFPLKAQPTLVTDNGTAPDPSPLPTDPPAKSSAMDGTSRTADSEQGVLASEKIQSTEASRGPDILRPETESEAVRKPTLIKPEESADNPSANRKASFTSRLQYYLVIGLVIIIVIVLILLVLMLLSRNKAKNALSPLSTDEYFQRQDETIASLNARIHEQLKRYDDA